MIREQRRLVRLAAPVLVVALVCAGCAGDTEHPAASSTSSSDIAVTRDAIKIGMQFPLTGPVASTGLPQMKAVRAYFDYLNDNGGIHGRTVELDVKDNAYDATKTVAAARSLVSHGCLPLS